MVGSSFFAAGVPVRDRDRLVDFPKDPVSAIVLRDDFKEPGWSWLGGSLAFDIFLLTLNGGLYPGNNIA